MGWSRQAVRRAARLRQGHALQSRLPCPSERLLPGQGTPILMTEGNALAMLAFASTCALRRNAKIAAGDFSLHASSRAPSPSHWALQSAKIIDANRPRPLAQMTLGDRHCVHTARRHLQVSYPDLHLSLRCITDFDCKRLFSTLRHVARQPRAAPLRSVYKGRNNDQFHDYYQPHRP